MTVTEREFEAAYARWAGPLHSYVKGLVRDASTAEDIVQGVFLRALAEPSPGSKPAGWWYRVARNAALNHIRDGLRKRIAGTEIPEVDSDEPPPLAGLARAEELDQVRAALATLSADHREALELHYAFGLTYAEVAEVVGVPEGTAKSRCHHALAALRRLLGANHDRLRHLP